MNIYVVSNGMKMKIARSSFRVLLFVLVFSLLILPVAPTFAQLGDIAAPTAEPAPVSEPVVAPEPVVESAPVVDSPAEAEGLEPEVQTTTETVTETVSGIPPTDTTAPTISGVADLSLGLSEATIVWTTDELATSRLEYGITQSYGQNATLEAGALLVHTAILTGLTPGTTYYYCIHATDLLGNTRNSCDHEFTTAVESGTSDGISVIVDTTPPDISLVTITSVNTDSVTINWTTDSVANS